MSKRSDCSSWYLSASALYASGLVIMSWARVRTTLLISRYELILNSSKPFE